MNNSITPPKINVPHASHAAFALDDGTAWDGLSPLTPFQLADGSAPAVQQTTVRVCFDETALYIRWDCEDTDIWGTYTKRDEPLYEQEVVEVFVGAGTADLIDYFEFQISPDGVLFDGIVFNPTSTREHLKVDPVWNCPGIRWMAQRTDAANEWWAAMAIPWSAITADGNVPTHCRANFYRIDRPHDGTDEYSCWSPTMTEPADFHKPAYFGILELTR